MKWYQSKSIIWAGLASMLGIMILSGCSSNTAKSRPQTQEEIQTKAMTPSPGKSLVYLYYGRALLGGGTSVSLDKMSSAIEKDTYVVWEVAPGTHQMQFVLKKLMSEEVVKRKISCEPNQIYYFRLYSETDTSRDPNVTIYSIKESSQSAGQDAVREFSLMAWFRDGSVVFQRDLEKPEEEQQATTSAQSQTPETVSEKAESPAETTSKESVTESSAQEKAATSTDVTQPEKVSDAAVQTPELKPLVVQGGYYALVIGISNYASLEPLPTAAKDAQTVATILRDTYGMKVNVLLDQKATRESILGAIEVFQRLLKPADKLIIYYAGYGQLDPDTQAASWLPADASLDSLAQWIPTETITASLKRIPANQILIVADSAYSGTLTRARQSELANPATRRQYLERLAEKVSRVVITSGALQPVAVDGGNGLSLFATVFTGALQGMSQSVFAAEELFFGSLQEQIAGQSDQLPEFQVIRNSGHIGGDFVFARP
ncbi:peptidase C14 caspase catalytic subunit p20 [Candidatus Moduliflexus flocculans]|uniref:Peptidase C14 caspase catalytic subunit p20 n=1 Tax=Candidatus Moduliflexus flocculans TaxID=1499966 RepID=A0A0S6VTE7_9BACT|nr:peptidase C14 caspase catalytic subunit p20 [Candidatus Moduliflexus flocculans]